MRIPIDYTISEIVPHAGRMSLLDRALEGDAENFLAELEIRNDGIFFNNGMVGGWVGIEYMAQTVAAWAGWRARLRGEEPRVGFLLGSRRYSCKRPQFNQGEILHINVQRVYQSDNGLGQFNCTITIDGEEVAAAALTVFEPQETPDYVTENKYV